RSGGRVRGRAGGRRGRASGGLRDRRGSRSGAPGSGAARARRRRRRRRPRRATGPGGVIRRPEFPVEPWTLRETSLAFDSLAQTESVFALANGHLGLRGNLDEGEPSPLPGTYLGGFYESRELPYAEAGFGYPEAGQTLVNVTNGKIIRLLVEDEPFDIRYGRLLHHERVLDLRAGVLERSVEWESPTGRRVRVRSRRLVSFAHRAVAAIHYEVEPLDDVLPAVIQSELIA